MKALIIEDEHVAAQALEALLKEVAPEMEAVAVLQTISESVEWFRERPMPDVVFMDIHLADGSSFSIFDSVSITCPIIFTTAYDEYALRAFTVNSIDYLLKPINKADLRRAVDKLQNLSARQELMPGGDVIAALLDTIRNRPAPYKSSLLVSVKDKLIPVATREIAYIYIESRIIHVVTFSGQRYVMDETMDELMQQLDSSAFYRANRQYIVAKAAVRDITLWFGAKLAVNLTVDTPERIFVSRTNTREFKDWLTSD